MQLLYFAPVPWNSYPQRPHYIVRELVRQGVEEVTWVDPYPTRLPLLKDFKRVSGRRECVGEPFQLPLEQISPHALPIEPLPTGSLLNKWLFWRALMTHLKDWIKSPLIIGCGRPSELAFLCLQEMSPSFSFFDAMDDFPLFYKGISRISMKKQEVRITRAVSYVIASSHGLLSKYHRHSPRPSLILNAYDMSDLPPVINASKCNPFFSYVGTMGKWFDWSWVIRFARQIPDIAVRLIGPVFSPPPSQLPSNIILAGAVRREAIADLIADGIAGIIPFKVSELTQGVDPIKYYEYRAYGLPVISTKFGEMCLRVSEKGVFLCDSPEHILSMLDDIIKSREDISLVPAFRKANDWTERLRGLLGYITHVDKI